MLLQQGCEVAESGPVTTIS